MAVKVVALVPFLLLQPFPPPPKSSNRLTMQHSNPSLPHTQGYRAHFNYNSYLTSFISKVDQTFLTCLIDKLLAVFQTQRKREDDFVEYKCCQRNRFYRFVIFLT